jgi:hypothetical protein
VKVTPAQTRLSRVATIAFAPGNGLNGRFLGRYSHFVDAGGWPVVLVYVDRTCRIDGRLSWTDVEADFGGPGLYALVVHHDTRGGHKLVVGPTPETLDLVVQF